MLLDHCLQAQTRARSRCGTLGLAEDLRGQIIRTEDAARAERRRALDRMLELADIAGPSVGDEAAHGLGSDGPGSLVVGRQEARQAVLGEKRNVLAPLPERGHWNRDDA